MCVTPQDLINYQSCCQTRICCSEEVLTSKILLATAIIENITCTRICPYEECKRFYVSHHSKTIFFNPVTTDKLLDAITITNLTTNEEILEYRNIGNRLEIDCHDKLSCGEIEICGSWSSYKTIPENIREAVILLSLERAQPGITGLNGAQGNITEVEWDDFRIEYNNNQQSEEIDSTGYFEIDRLISHSPTSKQIKFAIVDTLDKCCHKGNCSCDKNHK